MLTFLMQVHMVRHVSIYAGNQLDFLSNVTATHVDHTVITHTAFATSVAAACGLDTANSELGSINVYEYHCDVCPYTGRYRGYEPPPAAGY